ncbi:MAG: DUF4198 domain-containing protein [Planctomycetales bacterium]
MEILFFQRVLRCSALASCSCSSRSPLPLQAHDVWVQTNTNLSGSAIPSISTPMLGNYGNHHRLRLRARSILEAQLNLRLNGNADLKPDLVDVGYTPMRFCPLPRHYRRTGPAHHRASGRPDRQLWPTSVPYAVRKRRLRSLLLDKVDPNMPGFDKPLGHPLELVPLKHPILPMGPGEEIKVQLLFKGKTSG